MPRKPEVSIDVKAETKLAEARRDVARDFNRMEADARQAAQGIEAPFQRAGREVADSFSRSRSGVRDDLIGIESDARSAASGIDAPFRRAADDVEGSFDRARTGIRGEFSKIEGDAQSAASGLLSPFRRAFSDIEAEANRAAEGAGDQLEGLASGIDLTDVGSTVADQLQSALGAAGPAAGVVAGFGALFGEQIADGLTDGFSARRGRIDIAIRTGLSDIDVRAAGRDAAEVYSRGFGEGLTELRFQAAAVRKELEGFTLGAGSAEISAQVQLLADKFGIELAQSVEIARRQVANNLAPDVTTALGNILATAQELPLTFEEAIDVTDEYAATFGPLNVGGAQLVDWLADVQRSGAFENLDKGADAIRELIVRLNEADRARPALQELGLDLDKINTALEEGRGAAAINAIIDALLELESPADRARLTAELFGTATEDVTDKAAALQALRFDETWRDTAAAIAEATEAAEDSVGGFESARREVTTFFSEVGSLIDSGIKEADALFDAFDRLLTDAGVPGGTTERIEGLSASLDGVPEITARGGRSLEDFSLAADDAAGSAGDLRSELDLLFGFAPDQLVRKLKEETDRLAEAFAGADEAAVGLNGAIDIQAEGGADLQAQLERLAGVQRNSIELYNEGKISSDEFTASQDGVRASLREAGRAAGLTEDEIDGLIDKYLATPDEVKTVVKAEGVAEAQRAVESYGKALGRIPSLKTVTVRTRRVGNVRQFAEGGIAEGPSLVGEEGFELAQRGGRTTLVGVGGPEIVDFAGPTQITSHEKSLQEIQRRLSQIPRLANGGVAFREALALVGDNPNASSDPELITPESRMAAAFRDVLAEQGFGRGPLVNQLIVPPGRDAAQEVRNLEVVARTTV